MDYLENCPISFQISKSVHKMCKKERGRERERERVRYGHFKVKRKICFTNPSEKDVFNLSKCSQDDLLGN